MRDKGIGKSEEDVLSYALFPQVAEKFFAVRDKKTPQILMKTAFVSLLLRTCLFELLNMLSLICDSIFSHHNKQHKHFFNLSRIFSRRPAAGSGFLPSPNSIVNPGRQNSVINQP
ncbi:MAG: hypothetical protein ACLR56_06845 [Oscillospiraceae bacterium]